MTLHDVCIHTDKHAYTKANVLLNSESDTEDELYQHNLYTDPPDTEVTLCKVYGGGFLQHLLTEVLVLGNGLRTQQNCTRDFFCTIYFLKDGLAHTAMVS